MPRLLAGRHTALHLFTFPFLFSTLPRHLACPPYYNNNISFVPTNGPVQAVPWRTFSLQLSIIHTTLRTQRFASFLYSFVLYSTADPILPPGKTPPKPNASSPRSDASESGLLLYTLTATKPKGLFCRLLQKSPTCMIVLDSHRHVSCPIGWMAPQRLTRR